MKRGTWDTFVSVINLLKFSGNRHLQSRSRSLSRESPSVWSVVPNTWWLSESRTAPGWFKHTLVYIYIKKSFLSNFCGVTHSAGKGKNESGTKKEIYIFHNTCRQSPETNCLFCEFPWDLKSPQQFLANARRLQTSSSRSPSAVCSETEAAAPARIYVLCLYYMVARGDVQRNGQLTSQIDPDSGCQPWRGHEGSEPRRLGAYSVRAISRGRVG